MVTIIHSVFSFSKLVKIGPNCGFYVRTREAHNRKTSICLSEPPDSKLKNKKTKKYKKNQSQDFSCKQNPSPCPYPRSTRFYVCSFSSSALPRKEKNKTPPPHLLPPSSMPIQLSITLLTTLPLLDKQKLRPPLAPPVHHLPPSFHLLPHDRSSSPPSSKRYWQRYRSP